jgi:ABC-type transport system substrate-binding protein
MKRISKVLLAVVVLPFLLMLANGSADELREPRGEIRVVESARPDINVLGHNILQYLFEYSIDKNELAPSLGLSYEWIDDTIVEVVLRRGVRFHNGEPFDAFAVKFNFDYQRQHNPGRGIQVFLQNVKGVEIVDSYTVRMILDQPDALLMKMKSGGCRFTQLRVMCRRPWADI